LKEGLKILIILPDGKIHKLKIGRLVNTSFREAPLTATMLAALVPEEVNATIRIIDESIDKVDFATDYDLVAISCITGTSTRAYEIADFYRKNNITVVLGGVHVTLLPDEAKDHADSIVIGFGEQSWPQLIKDFVSGSLKKVYRSEISSLDGLPIPRRDLQRNFGYGVPNTIYATRGCRSNCDFCSIPAANYGWNTRPIGEVISELKTIKKKTVAFNDVNLTDDTEYSKELLKAMIPLKKKWGGLASTLVVKDDELLELLRRSGCIFLLIGFESIVSESLADMQKKFNRVDEYKALIDNLHRHNITIQGCFIFGLDHDNKNVFSDTVDFVNETKMDIPRYAVYTPYPKTAAFNKLVAENRILHYNWEYYDTQHVVFQPKNMTPEELDEGFKWAFKKTFRLRSIRKRNLGVTRGSFYTIMGNLAYKIYVRKLINDRNRFPDNPIVKVV
jgi:radical SAM superfamily enzyme YgiQ (UPF0313 family)